MSEVTIDAIRHLEKDLAAILPLMTDNVTTEIILNPHRTPNGNYEGHLLVEQIGVGLTNLITEETIPFPPTSIEIGDTLIVKYTKSAPPNMLYWFKLDKEEQHWHAILEQIVLQLRNYFNYSISALNHAELGSQNCPDISQQQSAIIRQDNTVSLIEYCQSLNSINLEKSLSHHTDITLYELINYINQNLPPNVPFQLQQVVVTKTNVASFQVHGKHLIKSNILKMSATKAETIMSVLASITGKFIHNKSPRLECQIPKYGHRFTGVLPPASSFPAFCIRKHARTIYTLDDFVNQGILEASSRDTIISWLKRKFNILIAGGTGSGKTTLANALLYEIVKIFPSTRMLIIEDVPELQFDTSRSIAFSTGEFFSMHDALRTTLRFKPDRIIMGEVRGAEAYTLLKAWNTGHPGGVATIHANGVNEAIYRFESCMRDHPEVRVNRQEIGFTINGIISIQNITQKEYIGGELQNIIKRKVTALRQIIQYDPDKDIYQDVIFDRVMESFD
jgi:type IV secretion system protein VirB11